MKLLLDSRDLDYFEKYGSTSIFPASFQVPTSIPESIQPIGNDQCTCYATCYIANEQDGMTYDVQDLWSRIPHTTSGAQPRDALGEAVKNGLRSAQGLVKHWQSYWRADTYGVGTDAFDAVRSCLQLSNSPVAIATPWYMEWRNQTILPVGKIIATYHMYCTSGWMEINGEPMLIIEAWTGQKLFMNRTTFNAAIRVMGSGAWVLSTDAIDKIAKISLLQTLIDKLVNLYINLRTSMNKPSLYEVAKSHLGEHLTLNESVSQEVGCAECWSKIASLAGIVLPAQGIASTAILLNWLENSPLFKEVYQPAQGVTIINATGTGNGKIPGHVGVLGGLGVMYINDYGIMSNDSDTGTLREHWSYEKWFAYYEMYGGMKTRMFAQV